MSPRLSRLRGGELLAGLGGLVVLIALFTLRWYGAHAATGWSAMAILRWVVVIDALAGLAVAVTQATIAAPAVPVSTSVVVSAIGSAITLVLLIRLLTASAGPQAGAYVGLAGAVAVAAGAVLSMRQESGWTPGPDHPLPTITLTDGQQ